MTLPTKAHKDIVIHLLKRTVEFYMSLKNREARRLDKNYLTAKNMLAKMTEQTAPDVLVYKLLRPELRLLQSQLSGIQRTLLESTIPTYMQRIDKTAKDDALTEVAKAGIIKQYEEYIAKNQERADLCKDVLSLLEKEKVR